MLEDCPSLLEDCPSLLIPCLCMSVCYWTFTCEAVIMLFKVLSDLVASGFPSLRLKYSLPRFVSVDFLVSFLICQ